MATNGLLSSDDELLFQALTTENTNETPLEFQSELTDDDAPDPLTLDEIANASLAALKSTLVSPVPPPAEDKTKTRPVMTNGQTNGSSVIKEHTNRRRNGVRFVDIEVPLPWLPPVRRAEYVHVVVEDYRPPTEDEYHRARRKRHRDNLDDFPEQFGTRKRKRSNDDAYVGEYDEDSADDYDEDDDISNPRGARPKLGPMDDYLDRGNGRRSTRTSTRASSLLVSSEGERGHSAETKRGRLRPRASYGAQYDDRDELQDSDGDGDDPTFAFVQSDIVQPKRRRKQLVRKLATRSRGVAVRASQGDSDIEFESRRRSSRANKNMTVMTDSYLDDDDIYYVEEDMSPAVPKIMSMREIFQTPGSEFREVHRPLCDSCGYGDDRNKGALIPCQGCSNSYHKACIGNRSGRDHAVTKVAPDSFVLQCRFCIDHHKKKDERAPSYDLCQGCHTNNPSCARFSQKKTPKQEETLRNENGGVDPITPVEPKLVNNSNNVFFRCGRCHRGWHYEHLPHPNRSRDPAIDDPMRLRKHRREEYQITWLCKTCQDTDEEKVGKIVAWRPVEPKIYTEGQPLTDFDEDSLEYLIKWDKKSYNHCIWVPGAWAYGVMAASMRMSFVRRTFGEGSDEGIDVERHADTLLRWSEKEAIHDVWITPDIILDVQYAPRSKEDEKKYRSKSHKDKFEDDLHRIFHVIKIYVKFEGLSYEDAVWDTPPSPDAGPLYEAYLDAYREFLNGKHFKSEPWRVMRERIEHFRELDFRTGIEVKEQPKGLQRGKLMEYQLEGLNWMLYNFRHERSVILADEMGLGKTVQVVALLSSFIQDSPRIWPFLIVVPNATCTNWRREIKKWAPDLRVVAYYGGRVSQRLALEYELFPNNARDMKAHVVIMSYDSVKDHGTRNRFSGVKWAGLVVDEAQALKNDENQLYKALNVLNIPFKLLLTGTPLQNNKRELFNLLQFIDPSMKAERLDEQFSQITSENLPELHEIIRPYFLRRTKAMVLTFLPPMAQIIVPVSMSVLQEKLCKSIMERNPQLIRSIFVQSKMKASERGSLSNILMQLRKCLCHPFIYSQAIEDRNASPELMRRNLIEASSKLMLLAIMLPKLKERGHRVLLFSQFLDQLTILEDFCSGIGLRHERLDGNQSSMEKQKKIDAFNAPNSDIFIMLLSTRAGGVGINLATADTVIILDPDWNPHQDIQALSRAHRIGQRKKVLCFQLMTVDSAEEKILQIGRKKLALDHLLIESMDNEEESPNDVESVLKHGAAALFGEGKKKEVITYDAAAVDKLLDRSMMEETKTDADKSAESAFAMARVWANDEGALAEDLQASEQNISMSVWDQILQQREEEARREAERNMEMLGRGNRRRGAANYTSYTGPRFEFDDNQDGAAAAESDQGDGDGDFVGSDKSAAESSDEESKPGTDSEDDENAQSDAESHTQSDRPQVHAQTAPSKKARGPRNAKGSSSKNAQETTTGAVLRPPASNSDSEEPPRHQQNGPGRPRKDTGSKAAAGTARAGGTGPPNGKHPNGASSLTTTQPPTSAVFTTRQPAGPNLISTSPIPVPTPPPAPTTTPKIRAQLCFLCQYMHPETWECPEMRSEVKLRLAMDRLRTMPGQTAAQATVRREFLVGKLRKVRAGDLAGKEGK